MCHILWDMIAYDHLGSIDSHTDTKFIKDETDDECDWGWGARTPRFTFTKNEVT